ncbi:MAG TPA: DUF5985 family protein [Rudaea sp.]|nr:DUF5985 family protein [Rudaea sp.]
MLASLVYALCAVTALLCAVLLLRSYARSRSRVLFWSGLCFTGLMVSNVVLVLDKLVYLDVDLQPLRLWITLVSLLMLLFGLIYANE